MISSETFFIWVTQSFSLPKHSLFHFIIFSFQVTRFSFEWPKSFSLQKHSLSHSLSHFIILSFQVKGKFLFSLLPTTLLLGILSYNFLIFGCLWPGNMVVITSVRGGRPEIYPTVWAYNPGVLDLQTGFGVVPLLSGKGIRCTVLKTG